MDRLIEMVRLHRMGVPDRKAAQMLKMGPNTHRFARDAFVRGGLWNGATEDLPSAEALRALLPQRKPPQQVSTLDRWIPLVDEAVRRGLNAKAIHDRLRLDHPEFDGSYDAMKRLVTRLRKGKPPSEEDVVVRVETAPGDVAQVDFGYIGLVVDPATGEQRRAWVFVMTLGFSRHFFARIVFDQSIATWIDLHVRAFAFFGAVPHTLVPDNLKAAVIRAAFGIDDDVEAQRDYRELARHYDFKIDPTPPRSPKKKGKVERNVRFVQGFLDSRDADADIVSVNHDLMRWNVEIASQRVHGTTHRVPSRSFEEDELSAMGPLPVRPWVPTTWRKKVVEADAHVFFDRRWYSVPWTYLERDAWIQATPDRVRVWIDDEVVAEHDRRGAGLRSTLPGHQPDRAAFAERSPAAWRERAASLGPEVAAWVDEQLAHTVSRLKVVQGAVLYLETLPEDQPNAVCRRAREFGSRRLGELRNIARLGLHRRDAAVGAPEPAPAAPPSKFARSLSDLARHHKEVAHVSK